MTALGHLVASVLCQVAAGDAGLPCGPQLEILTALPHLRIRGLMTMPPWYENPEKVRPYFRALRRAREHLQSLNLPGVDLPELSMGMSGDFKVAIAEGATLVRIGTALFGARPH